MYDDACPPVDDVDPAAGASELCGAPPENHANAPAHPIHRRRSFSAADTADLLALIDGGMTVVAAASRLSISTTSAYRLVRAVRGRAHPERSYVRRALPIGDWPEELRTGAGVLNPSQRQVVGKLLGFAQLRMPAGTDVLAPKAIDAFLSWRSETVKAVSVGCECAMLFGAMLKLLPDRDWLWLKRETSRRRRKIRPEGGQRKGGGRTHSLGVPMKAWPAAHRIAIEAAFSPGTPGEFAEFPDDPGPLCNTSSAFRNGLARCYGLFLGCMRRNGRPDAVTPEDVQLWINELRGRKCRPRTIATYVDHLHRTVKIVDGATPEWLTLTRDDMISRARLAPKKKDGRHVDPTDLWLIGQALIREARSRRRERETTALLFRDGLIFMLLSSTPVRLANLAMIEIGRHLVLPRDRQGSLKFDGEEMKGNRSAVYALWPELRAVIAEYVALYRPVLAGDYAGNALWLCERGAGPLKKSGLYAAIIRVTTLCAERLGGPVNPHLFRDAVATALIERHPDRPEYATSLLQHRHLETTREYQEAAESTHAALRLAGILEETRARLRAAA